MSLKQEKTAITCALRSLTLLKFNLFYMLNLNFIKESTFFNNGQNVGKSIG